MERLLRKQSTRYLERNFYGFTPKAQRIVLKIFEERQRGLGKKIYKCKNY